MCQCEPCVSSVRHRPSTALKVSVTQPRRNNTLSRVSRQQNNAHAHNINTSPCHKFHTFFSKHLLRKDAKIMSKIQTPQCQTLEKYSLNRLHVNLLLQRLILKEPTKWGNRPTSIKHNVCLSDTRSILFLPFYFIKIVYFLLQTSMKPNGCCERKWITLVEHCRGQR